MKINFPMAKKLINVPRNILMLLGYLSFLFGSGGLTFQIFSFSKTTGELSIVGTLTPIILMALGVVLVFIAYKLNKYKSEEQANTSQ